MLIFIILMNAFLRNLQITFQPVPVLNSDSVNIYIQLMVHGYFFIYLSDIGVVPRIRPIHTEPSTRKILLDKFFQWTQLIRGVLRYTGTTQRAVLKFLGDEPGCWTVEDIRRFYLILNTITPAIPRLLAQICGHFCVF